MRESVLVFDFGTSYFKAALVDDQGAMIAFHRIPTPIVRNGDRSEIDPDVFRQVVRVAVRTLGAESPGGLAGVRAVTFCTQANTFILLDEAGRALTPFIVWNDERAKPLAPSLAQLTDDPAYTARTGIPRLNPCFALAKVHWLTEHDPALLQRTRRLRFLADAFVHWLSGHHVTDGSVAALSGLFDVENWRWSPEWCARANLPVDWLPAVVRGGSCLGTIGAGAAAELGLPPDCQVVMGCLDQYAGAIGVGNDQPGGFSETTGTVLATVRCASTFAASASAMVFRGPATTPGAFYHMTFGDISASLLEFYRRQLPDHPTFEALDLAAVESTDPVPKLDPHLPLEQLRSLLCSWVTTHPRGAVVRCIYETVAAALARQVRELADEEPIERIRSAGGASRSRRWLQCKANALGIPVLAPYSDEPTLLGAASLAAAVLQWKPFIHDSEQGSTDRLVYPERQLEGANQWEKK